MALAQSRSRPRFVIAATIEGLLLLAVIVTVVHFAIGYIDTGSGWSAWVAALLVAMTLLPFARRRLLTGSWERGRPVMPHLMEGDIQVRMWTLWLAYAGAMATGVICARDARRSGDPESVWLLGLLFVMVLWPMARHPIVHGEWQQD